MAGCFWLPERLNPWGSAHAARRRRDSKGGGINNCIYINDTLDYKASPVHVRVTSEAVQGKQPGLAYSLPDFHSPSFPSSLIPPRPSSLSAHTSMETVPKVEVEETTAPGRLVSSASHAAALAVTMFLDSYDWGIHSPGCSSWSSWASGCRD